MDHADARRLWLMQLRLECKHLDSDGRLVRAPGDSPDEIPVAAVTRFSGCYEWVFGESAPSTLVDEIRGLAPEGLFTGEDLLRAKGLRLERCSTYRFATEPSPADGTVALVRTGPESYAAVVGGREVAWASSSRTNGECAELWVRTDPAYQRRGYARQVAAAWAGEVTASGRVAFYSHLAENDPSRRLALSLGVTHLFDLAAFVGKSVA